MLATRERLIGNLYSGLDPAPDQEAALRLGSNGALSWLIANGKLTITEDNGLVTDFPLTGTIGDLAKALAKTTIEVKYFNADVQHLSAGTLIDGSGLESESNGDLLSIFTSTLWAIMDAYAVELDAADNNIDEAIADLYINSATGEMLDIWGQYFADPRQIGEADSAYSQRIIVDTLRPKSNKYALINAAKAIFGSKIDIYEPWQDLFFLSESSLDNQHTYDGDMWSPYVFRPQLRAQQNINWSGVTALFEKLRPAAVFQLPPEFIPDTRGNQAGIKGLGIAQTEHVFSGAIYADKTNLDDYKLGDPIVNNYRISIYDIYAMGLYKLLPFSWANAQNQVVTPYNWAGPWDSKLWEKSVAANNGWDSKVWNQLYPGIPTPIPEAPLQLNQKRLFVRADLVLSDMDEKLGDLRCRTTMKTVTSKNTPMLDDFTLSDFDNGCREVAEEDVYWPDYVIGAEAPRPSLGLTYCDNRALSASISNNRALSASIYNNTVSEVWCVDGWGYYGDNTWATIENSAIKSSVNALVRHWSGSWDGSAWISAIKSGFCISKSVVTISYLELNPTPDTEIYLWSGSWDSRLWASYAYSRICIKSTTESL